MKWMGKLLTAVRTDGQTANPHWFHYNSNGGTAVRHTATGTQTAAGPVPPRVTEVKDNVFARRRVVSPFLRFTPDCDCMMFGMKPNKCTKEVTYRSVTQCWQALPRTRLRGRESLDVKDEG